MPERTTMTLDDDVARAINEETRRSGRSMREVVNEALRRGLVPPKRSAVRRFRIQARELRARPGVAIDDVEGLLDQVDGADRR